MEASALDLRTKLADILAAIERNQTVVLTYRGKRKALIVPFEEQKTQVSAGDLPAFGMWADRDDFKDPVAALRKMREPRRF
ncbi:MAG: type II toxin-antitoxin system Phd/YefM family antitoxin [Lentisphaeria bacterium]|nr:type II toxin-antitoxin system Phd/YefM family antitoxin [Lentisphaeria bacterium]